jgi:DNA-binding MarR family transcriptional regulator
VSRSSVTDRKKPAGDGETATVRPVRVGALGDSIGYALRRAQLASTAEFLEAMKEVDLRPTQFSVLILINENPGVRQTEVCAALGLQKANFVPLLNELERRGLAERRPGVPDRRASALHLTEHGTAVLRRALDLHSQWEDRVSSRLGPKGREQLLALLRKLT